MVHPDGHAEHNVTPGHYHCPYKVAKGSLISKNLGQHLTAKKMQKRVSPAKICMIKSIGIHLQLIVNFYTQTNLLVHSKVTKKLNQFIS